MPNKKRTTEVDVLGEANVNTLQEYFEALNKGYLDLEKLRKEQEKRLAENQKQYILDSVKKEVELKKMYSKLTEDELTTFRKKALDDFNKYQKSEQLKLAKEYADQQLKEMKKKGLLGKIVTSANKQKERESKHDENMELYTSLKALGGKRSKEQDQQLKEVASELKKEGGMKALKNTMKNLINSLDKLNAGIDKYATYSGKINARLQGYNTNATLSEKLIGGSQPFGVLETRLTNAVGITPYFKTETMLDNLQSLVEQGIAENVEQRAFLQTAKDGIATTFDVANSTLLRIIRLQQQDSTAARLGLEAYLTKYLNELVSSTEYLNNTFDTVAENLIEASSQMTTSASAEFEYVIQKWLGSLVGVGLSESTATNIAQAIGYLGSGNIDALNSSNLQNLLVMAASNANLSYADMLENGLSASTANQLMEAIVKYMIQIGSSSSNVVKSQFAQTFGISVSDLRAAQSLESSLSTISDNYLTYSDMYNELGTQLSEIPSRLNVASMIDTVWSNLEFSLASNISKNPALAAIWKVTGLIQENTGGINIPFITAMGSGFDLNTTVENLVKLGVVGVSSLGMIGDLISGIQSTANPSSILSELGIEKSYSSAIVRGSGLKGSTGKLETSLSAMQTISNSSGEDISNAALAGASDSAKEEITQQMSDETTLKDVKELLEGDMTNNLIKLQQTMTEVLSTLKDPLEVKVTEMPYVYRDSLIT